MKIWKYTKEPAGDAVREPASAMNKEPMNNEHAARQFLCRPFQAKRYCEGTRIAQVIYLQLLRYNE